MMCIDDSQAYFCSTDAYPLSYKTTHIKICELKECSLCVEFQSSIECVWLLIVVDFREKKKQIHNCVCVCASSIVKFHFHLGDLIYFGDSQI